MEQKELKKRLDNIGNWHANGNKGVIDAIIDVGRCLEHMYGDNNTGSMEAMHDSIDNIIGSPEMSIPEEYAEKYLHDEPRCNAYIHIMNILRSLAHLKGW